MLACPRQLSLPLQDIAAGTVSVATLDGKGAVAVAPVAPHLKQHQGEPFLTLATCVLRQVSYRVQHGQRRRV